MMTRLSAKAMIHQVGKPYYSYYMYEYAGVDPETGLESYYINDGMRMLARPLLM